MVFCTNSCKKDQTTNDLQRSDQIISIAEAKNYFQQNFSEAKSAEILKNNPNPTPFQKIKKTVLWDEAKECEISLGKAVRVPIYYDKQYIYRAGKNQQAMDLYNLSHLMIYKDKSNKIHTEWVVALPDDDYVDQEQKIGATFSGFIAIRDWYGTLLNGFKIDNKNEIHFISGYSESGQVVSGLKTMAYETVRTCTDFSVTICARSLTNGNESLECTVSSVCFNHLVFVGGSNVNNGGMPASGSPASGGPGITNPKDYIPTPNKCPENNGVALESTSGITTMWVNPEFNYFNPGEIAGDPCGESRETPVNSSLVLKMYQTDMLKYPLLTNIVSNLDSYVLNNPKLLDAISKFSLLSKQDIISNLKFGEGALIVIKDMGDDYYGFQSDGTIYLNSKYIAGLENIANSSKYNAIRTFLIVQILHEFIHWGNYQSFQRYPGNDAGTQFECSEFGGTVEYDYSTKNVSIKPCK